MDEGVVPASTIQGGEGTFAPAFSSAADRRDPTGQFLGTGELDFGPIAAALHSIGYARPLDVIARGTERWPPKRTTAALRAALERARALFATRS